MADLFPEFCDKDLSPALILFNFTKAALIVALLDTSLSYLSRDVRHVQMSGASLHSLLTLGTLSRLEVNSVGRRLLLPSKMNKITLLHYVLGWRQFPIRHLQGKPPLTHSILYSWLYPWHAQRFERVSKYHICKDSRTTAPVVSYDRNLFPSSTGVSR